MSGAVQQFGQIQNWVVKYAGYPAYQNRLSRTSLIPMKAADLRLLCVNGPGMRHKIRGENKPECTETPFRGPEIYAWSVPAAKLLDFTAGTYVPGPSKLATFAIEI